MSFSSRVHLCAKLFFSSKHISCVLQILVREIKVLIKEQSKAGVKGPLDFTSDAITDKLHERNLQQNTGLLKKAAGGLMGLNKADEIKGGGIMSVMNQLAWEHDLDLSKGKPPIETKSPRDEKKEENANNSNSTSRPGLRSGQTSSVASTASSAGKDNTGAVFSDGDMSPVETNTRKTELDNKTPPPKSAKTTKSAKSASRRPPSRVTPATGGNTIGLDGNKPNSNNSNSNVSEDVGGAGRATPARRSARSRKTSAASTKAKLRRKPRGATLSKERSGSGGSVDSKDSLLSEGGASRRSLQDRRQNSNSSASLSSLMNAWGNGDGDQSTDL